MMKIGRTDGKGQVFSIDILFVLLPILMILGASLQYLYLVEEQAISLSETNNREVLAQGLGNYAVESYAEEDIQADENLCEEMDSLVDVTLPEDYKYFFRTELDKSDSGWCRYSDDADLEHYLYQVNNPGGSDSRFILAPDGRIVEVSFTTWYDYR